MPVLAPVPVTPVAPVAPVTPVTPVTPVVPAPAPEPAEADDEDFGATVVVDRHREVAWSLVLDDGTALPLALPHVLLGRKPLTSDPRTQALVVPDPTLTLSKVHARLDLEDGIWTITDLGSTNGVILVDDDGTERLASPGDRVAASGRFMLGKVAMSIQQRTEK